MAKYERFSTVLQSPDMMKVGQRIILESGKDGVITSISKVEFISNRLVLISGNSKVIDAQSE